MHATRRHFLRQAILGSVGLRAAATGIPAAFFLSGFPDSRADGPEAQFPQFVLLINSRDGDPVNANAPGSYGVDGVVNNPQPQMAATPLQLGDTQTVAAAPWATLPQAVLDRTCFIHHRTYQNAHPQHEKVMGLVGSAKREDGSGTEQLPALLASENAEALGTLQREPVAVGGPSISFGGSILQTIQPRTLARIFAPAQGEALGLAQLRDQTLDRIHADLTERGTPSQRAWLERHVSSRRQVDLIDESLLARFDAIAGNTERDQVSAAIALFLMKIAPVVTVEIGFGGDNHADPGLTRERDETVEALAVLGDLFAELDAAGLTDDVTVCNLSVFGRTLAKKGTAGRDHNLNHHVMMVSGTNVSPGVYGGIIESGNDFGAAAIDSTTGAADGGGDIPVDQTLEAAAKTLGCIAGVSSSRLEVRIDGGKVISPAVLS